MNISSYEKHYYEDSRLPVLFHLDRIEGAFAPHWHENIELLVPLNGEIDVRSDNVVVHAVPGDMAVVNSNCIHNITSRNFSQTVYYCLIIDKKYCESVGFSPEDNRIKELITDSEIISLFNHIPEELRKKEPYYKEAVKIHCALLMLNLFRKHKAANDIVQSDKQIKMIKDGISFINKNYAEDISLSDIADYAGYSKYHFCHRFKEITGTTVAHFLNSVRIEHACKLIAQEEMTLSEISSACGFTDNSYFTKIFKKYKNCNPSNYTEA